uniref:Reverse transcriptase domain-containing protein n=1 Tax=Trichogramma kaykai TaxID=54128 RepID=A0ABD2WZ70_9HYME
MPANIRHLLRDVTRDANAVCEWATINGLTCNAAKTKVMLIGSLSFVTLLRPSLPAGLDIGGEIVPFSEEIKTLGVFLSEKFNWDQQIAFMTAKVHHSLYALRFYEHALSRKMRLMLVGALVAPHLNYPAPLLTDLTKKQTLALQCLQNACIRFIYGTIPRTAHVISYRLALGRLSAGGRR